MFKGAYMRSVPIGLPLVAAAFLAGCATTPGGQRLAERDPLESWNRHVWAFNRGVDTALLKPGAKTYQAVPPQAAGRGVRKGERKSVGWGKGAQVRLDPGGGRVFKK